MESNRIFGSRAFAHVALRSLTHLSSVVIDKDASQLLVGGRAVGVGRVWRRLGAAGLRCVAA